MKGFTESWLRANHRGISDEDLERALAQGSTRQPVLEWDVSFEPVIRRDVRIWIRINGWRAASLNEMARSVRGKVHLKQRDRAIVCEAARLAGIPRATGKRQISMIIRVPKSQRRWDPDALWKSTLDACKHACLIVDDSPVYLQLGQLTYDRERGPLRTTIVLEDLP